MKKIALILLFFSVSISQSLIAQTPDWLVGVWKGFGHQPNGLTQTDWSIQITIKSAEGKISVDYSSLKCGGTWTLQTAEPTRCVFVESLTYGRKNCIDGGKCIVSKIDDHYIHVAFYNDSYDATKITSSSLLRKEK